VISLASFEITLSLGPTLASPMADPTERERERRHAELIEKHVYGDRERRKIDGKAEWFRWTSAASVGLEIAVAISLCTLAAHWIENEYTHWSPWTTLIGLAIGLGAAVKAVVRTIRQYERELEAQDRAERERAEP
jgi:F0F1-type ATP synthase assembly protein I